MKIDSKNQEQKNNQVSSSQQEVKPNQHQNFHTIKKPLIDQTNFSYYHQYCRLYIANIVLTNQMKQLVNQKNQLMNRLARLQVILIHKQKTQQLQQGLMLQDQRKKRVRRPAAQIARHYKCQIQNCMKSYGSQGSLNQHIKLKHPQLYATMVSSHHQQSSKCQQQSSKQH